MSTYDWLLFLHVLGAVAIVAALVLFTAGLVAARRSERPSGVAASLALARQGGILFDVGGFAVLVLGIWLAFDADYGLDDAWIIAALVFWVVAAAAGTRARASYLGARARADDLARDGDAPSAELAALVRDRKALALFVGTVLAVFAMLLLMIFKPGAG